MYGVAVRMYATGRTVLSSTLRRAASAPTRLPGDVAEHDRRDEQRERVRDRGPDQVADRRADVRDARAEVAVEEAAPEVEVLLPERLVEPERLREVAVELLRGGGVGLEPRDQAVDRVAGHQPRDRPVDRDRDEEGDEVEDDLAGEVAAHAVSGRSWCEVRGARGRGGARVRAPPDPGREASACALALLQPEAGQRVDARHVEVAVPDGGRELGRCRPRGSSSTRTCCTAPTCRCTRAGSQADPRGWIFCICEWIFRAFATSVDFVLLSCGSAPTASRPPA